MLLSHTHRFIYTKTIKTAGTSVEIYFEDACLPPNNSIPRDHFIEQTVTWAGVIGYRGTNSFGRTWWNHMPAKDIRALTGRTIWDQYFKFCVIRNPFDKLVSLWWFIQAAEGNHYDPNDFPRIRSDFSRWSAREAHQGIDRDQYLIDGEIAVDYFIRYESLTDGLAHVCHRVGYPFDPNRLGAFKSESRLSKQPFEDYYDRDAIAAVEANFAWELATFGYSSP